jgi:antibiotic biosynthesis monooxygenase (ABM) superfamily enzyme
MEGGYPTNWKSGALLQRVSFYQASSKLQMLVTHWRPLQALLGTMQLPPMGLTISLALSYVIRFYIEIKSGLCAVWLHNQT